MASVKSTRTHLPGVVGAFGASLYDGMPAFAVRAVRFVTPVRMQRSGGARQGDAQFGSGLR